MIVLPCGFPSVFAMPSILGSRQGLHERTALSLVFLAASALPLAAVGVGLGFAGDAVLGLLDTMKAKMTFAVVLYSLLGIVAIGYALSELGVIRLPSLTEKIRGANMPGQDRPYRRSLVLGSTMGAGMGMGCPMPTYYILLGWVADRAEISGWRGLPARHRSGATGHPPTGLEGQAAGDDHSLAGMLGGAP